MKRIMSVLAVLCISALAVTLTGCGEKKQPETTAAPAAETTAAETKEETAAPETQAVTESPAPETEAASDVPAEAVVNKEKTRIILSKSANVLLIIILHFIVSIHEAEQDIEEGVACN